MNFYPSELVTPPLALVALLGCPRLHQEVGEFLRSQHKPPINSLGLADPWAAARLFGERKSTLTAPADRTGILKANWFVKHRHKRPAVAVLFLERSAVVGGQNEWAVTCSALEAVRSAAKARNAKLAVVVVGGSAAELPEERTGALCRIAALDKKWLVLFDTTEGDPALKRLGRLLYEAAGQFYLDAARRRLSLHSERRSQTPELNARVAFKAAALAEFRTDWATAVKTYQNAYAEVSRVGLGPPLPLQRAHEVAAVAEQVHVKVVTLLLHQQRIQEALQQFKTHMGLFRRPPFTPPPAFAAAHWGWVSRQYSAMAELLSSRVDASLLPAQKEAQPAHLFLCSAQAAIERRQWAQRAARARGGSAPAPLDLHPSPGQFVGQVLVLNPPRRLTDEEFVQFLEVQEAGTEHTSLALEALSTAQELCAKATGTRGTRQAYFIGQLIAQEHLAAGDAATAHRLLLLVAGIFRREQWGMLLASALLDLRECAKRLKLTQDEILYSLEVASLEHTLLDDRKKIASAAVRALLAGPGNDNELVAFNLQVKPVNHPLLSCFLLTAGFLRPKADERSVFFGLALYSFLPIELPFRSLEIALVLDSKNEFTTVRLEVDDGADVVPPDRWLFAHANFDCETGAHVTAKEVRLYVGDHSTVQWNLPVFAGFEILGGVSQDAAKGRLPETKLRFTPGLFEVAVPAAHEPVEIKASGHPFGLVGETLPIVFIASSKGAVSSAILRVQAEYLEGGPPPQLSFRDADGSLRQSSGSEQIAIEGAADSAATIELPAMELSLEEQQKTLELLVLLPQKGQLLVSATLSFDSAKVSTTLEMTVEAPLALTSRLYTLPHVCSLIVPPTQASAEPSLASVLPVDEICLLSTQLRVTAPTEVEILSVSAQTVSGVECLDPDKKGQQPIVGFCKGDVFTKVFRIRGALSQRHSSLGNLLISWKRRRKAGDAVVIHTKLKLEGAEFVKASIQVRAELPGHAILGEAFTMRLVIQNLTAMIQLMTVAVGDSSGFVIAGNRHDALSVLPHSTAEHDLTLVGYTAGSLPLPHVRVIATRYSAVVEPLAGYQQLISPAGLSADAELRRAASAETRAKS